MSGEDDTERDHEPTQKKLDDARARGEIARSADLTAAASYAGLLAGALALGGWSLARIGSAGMTLIDQADTLGGAFLSGGSAIAAGLMAEVAIAAAPWLLLPALAVLGLLLGQRGLVFAPEKLAPRLSRISPLANARNKFGRAGLFEFAKSAVKLLIVSVILTMFLLRHLPDVMMSQHLAPALVTTELGELAIAFLVLVLLVAAAFGGVDFLWQWFEHRRRNRMSRQELLDEMKQSEGDPHIKGQRRQRAIAIATNRMLAEVPKADVVIVNPTHYAVALRWNRADRRAPVCVAKGTDEIAARIRERAAEAGVPIRSDPPTARAIYASVDIGQEIRPEQFRAVAAAIRFAEKMRTKARKQGAR